MTQLISLKDSDATEKFGARLGRALRGGEVIELISDLGGGKTTLTRGLASGAGSSDVVGSPSFMISKVYKSPKFEIHHFDFYRLTEAGLMEHELQDVLIDPNAVVIVEWGDVVQHVLPLERLTIHIDKTSDGAREAKINYPQKLAYLLEDK